MLYGFGQISAGMPIAERIRQSRVQCPSNFRDAIGLI
jgi:hypothetical protein